MDGINKATASVLNAYYGLNSTLANLGKSESEADSEDSTFSIEEDFINSTANAYGKVVNAALGGIDFDEDEDDGMASMFNTLLSMNNMEEDGTNSELLTLLQNNYGSINNDRLQTLLSSNIYSTLELTV